MDILKNLFCQSKFSCKEIYELNSALDFFQKEFNSLDPRTLAILKSEISRITNIFVADYNVSQVFCPPKDKLNSKLSIFGIYVLFNVCRYFKSCSCNNLNCF